MTQEPLQRLSQHSLEAEVGVIGCLLEDCRACAPICQELIPVGSEAFYDLRNGLIYEQIMKMSAENLPVDMMTVYERLKRVEQLDAIGGLEYLDGIMSKVTSTLNLSYYIGILMDRFVLRKVSHVCAEIADRSFDGDVKPDELLDEFEQKVMAIRPFIKIGERTIKDQVSGAMAIIEEHAKAGGKLEGISTGLVDLDRKTDGLRKGEVTVVAGYPGSGKTSLAMNVAENASIKNGLVTLVFSLEMSAESLIVRFLCAESRTNIRDITHGDMRHPEMSRLTTSAASIAKSKLFFEDESDISIYRLRAKARRYHQKQKLDLIVIDYIQLLNAFGGNRKVESRQQEVADISRGIKAMAREFNVPVIALSQLNDDGRLRESRSIGQDADNVWILEATESEDEAVPVNLKIIKARNGPTGQVPLIFVRRFTRFENAAKITTADIPI